MKRHCCDGATGCHAPNCDYEAPFFAGCTCGCERCALPSDYEQCGECGWDHAYEPEQAREAHEQAGDESTMGDRAIVTLASALEKYLETAVHGGYGEILTWEPDAIAADVACYSGDRQLERADQALLTKLCAEWLAKRQSSESLR